MTQDELVNLADNWIRYHQAPKGSAEKKATEQASEDVIELQFRDPETLWLLILAIHERDQSEEIQSILAAGPVESLLGKYGERFIERVDTKARKDPTFTKMLAGVWRSSMTRDIWNRVQVWQRVAAGAPPIQSKPRQPRPSARRGRAKG
jgi:uncharacterized protein DUF6869